jgi:hypothetical protein
MRASISASRQAWRPAGAREWRRPGRSAGRHLLSFRSGDKPFALGLLARELAGSPGRFAFPLSSQFLENRKLAPGLLFKAINQRG